MYAWVPTLIGIFCIYVYKLEEMALPVVFILILLAVVAVTKFEKWFLGEDLGSYSLSFQFTRFVRITRAIHVWGSSNAINQMRVFLSDDLFIQLVSFQLIGHMFKR